MNVGQAVRHIADAHRPADRMETITAKSDTEANNGP